MKSILTKISGAKNNKPLLPVWCCFNRVQRTVAPSKVGKSPIGSSADCDFPHRASPLVSPKPAENRRLPPPYKIQSLSPSGSGSLHFSALRNRVRPLPVRWLLALRSVPRRRIRRTQAERQDDIKSLYRNVRFGIISFR